MSHFIFESSRRWGEGGCFRFTKAKMGGSGHGSFREAVYACIHHLKSARSNPDRCGSRKMGCDARKRLQVFSPSFFSSLLSPSLDTTFRFTPKNTRIILILGLVIPSSLYVLARDHNAKWDWAGKTRDQSLLKNR